MPINSYDPIDTCPYDPVHRIMRSRMQYHLTKCAKNWPSAKKKQCPYDARHVVNQMEFDYHLSICPQRETMIPNVTGKSAEAEKLQILPIDTSPAVLSEDAIWGEDSHIQSYDPVKLTENRLVTRVLIGASKAQRKKHRKQERERIAQLVEASNTEKEEQDIRPLEIQTNNNQHVVSLIEPTILEEASKKTEEKCESLRLKVRSLDTSKISEISATNSTIVKKAQNSFDKNASLQYMQKQSKPKKKLNLQTFSYVAAAKNALPNKHHVTERKKYDFEEDNNNNSSMPNRNQEKLDLQTKTFSYAAAAKNEPKNLRVQYGSIERKSDAVEGIKRETEKKDRNKEDLDLQTTQSYTETAAHEPLDQYQQNDFGSQSKPFTYASAASNMHTNQRQNTGSTQNYNLQEKAFSCASAAKNEFQRQRCHDIVNDFDDDLVQLSKTVETLTIGEGEIPPEYLDNLRSSNVFHKVFTHKKLF